jgi:hypothetical protein
MTRRLAGLGLAIAMSGSIVHGQGTAATQTTTPGPVVVQTESVGPQRTRLRVTRNGAVQATLESSAFTIRTDSSGTTITSAAEMHITEAAGSVSTGRFEVRFPADKTSWLVRQYQPGVGQVWQLHGPNSTIGFTTPND